MTHPEDRALAEQVIARDPEALVRFAERVACVSAYVRGVARRMGWSVAETAVDDVVQETYLALWRKLPQFRGESRLETWAIGFAAFELRRFAVASARSAERREDALPEPSASDPAPDDLAELVEGVLVELGPPASDVIRLKHFEELSFPAIAARLDLPQNTAKSLYYRGLARIRARLGARAEGLLP